MNEQAKHQQAILDNPAVTNSKSEMEVREKHFAAPEIPKPPFRRLRGYALDPSLSGQLDTAFVNEITYQVPWEEKSKRPDEGLMPGPVGEYVEVVDYDPASECFYNPVDLNNELILAQDGLMPSEGNPQFHQQMVYAVVMTTIANFEKALGRKALWSPGNNYQFVRRLRVYPHALREANAYYSNEKKALLFGYFPASGSRPGKFFPGGMVFTCLSHDIIAHETTHALLDGTYALFVEASHPDSLAFHEAFADIVALFQHFTFLDVLRHQIGKTRGDLKSQNLLGELAQQFGEAIGNYGALRSAIVKENPDTGQLERFIPDPDDYKTATEPHERGAILVAAVFDAFIAIYERRVADLLRIASSGTGILPEGELHPDLVNRLAEEAGKAAQHVLNVCIRALDYCPPVDINFGDYLRAMITADRDLVSNDEKGYRIAIIEAFRGRGIYPRDIRVLSTESLCWPKVDRAQGFFKPIAEQLRADFAEFGFTRDRKMIFDKTEKISMRLNRWIRSEGYRELEEFSKVAGIRFDFELEGMRRSKDGSELPAFQIHSLRPARRVGPDGKSLNQLIMSIVQTRELAIQDVNTGKRSKGTLKFRGGSTLILDLDTMTLQYAITKKVDDEARLRRFLDYRGELEMEGSLRATYFKGLEDMREPFAMLHRSLNEGRP